ncbi:MAG: DUF3048 domain-containing protein [Oscillospiraceae bacterium]|nr:DUF3048 domain-containing protein [Oscillospiraceae bacterium]
MKHAKKILFAAALCACLSLTGCSSKVDLPESTGSQAATSGTTVTEITSAETQITTDQAKSHSDIQNPLTGEYDYNEAAVGKRPIAIMINNISQSLPQYGIGSADYIYEVVVEGGITRMMGVFADYTNIPNVCSIRSCRYYYPIIAYGLDAIYCHWGMDKTIAAETLDRLDIDRFDGDDSAYYGSLFYNDEERLMNYDREHTGYIAGSEIPAAIERAGYRTDLSEDEKHNLFDFNTEEAPISPSGTSCTELNVIFSDSYYSTFTFDSESGTYLKQHSGDPQIDATTGNQLAFTNVFVLRTTVSPRGVGQLMDVELSSGTGYYVSNGMAQEINWSKPAENQNFVITDTSGNPIKVNRGKCYFGITDNVSLG